MKCFRNSGWEYYDKVQAILPNSSARGSRAFSPHVDNTHDDPPDPLEALVISRDDGDQDNDANASGSRVSTGKRKRSGQDDEPLDNDVNPSQQPDFLSQTFPPSAIGTSSPAASTPDTRSFTGKGASGAAIYGLQTALNRLIDTLQQSMTQPPPRRPNTPPPRHWAVALIDEDDSLTDNQKLKLMSYLLAKPEMADLLLNCNSTLRHRMYAEMMEDEGLSQ